MVCGASSVAASRVNWGFDFGSRLNARPSDRSITEMAVPILATPGKYLQILDDSVDWFHHLAKPLRGLWDIKVAAFYFLAMSTRDRLLQRQTFSVDA